MNTDDIVVKLTELDATIRVLNMRLLAIEVILAQKEIV